MHWVQQLDTQLFRWNNSTLSNSFLDVIMPFLSGNPFFVPVLLLGFGFLIWKDKLRGAICVVMLLLAILLGESLVVKPIKEGIGRLRPFKALADVHVPPGVGLTASASMPSSHALNWFAATMIL